MFSGLIVSLNQLRLYFKISFIFNFLFHNSHDIFDRQIIVSNSVTKFSDFALLSQNFKNNKAFLEGLFGISKNL